MYTLSDFADFARRKGSKDKQKRRRRVISREALKYGIIAGGALGLAGGLALTRGKKFNRTLTRNIVSPYQQIETVNLKRRFMKPLERTQRDLVKKVGLKMGSGDQELRQARDNFFANKKKIYRTEVVGGVRQKGNRLRRNIKGSIISGATVSGATTGGVLGYLTGRRINRSLDDE